MTQRRVVHNKIKNGDLLFLPPFVAIQSTGSRWIDGTSGGSLTNDIYGWYALTGVAQVRYQFDQSVLFNGKPSIKIDALDITGRGRVLSAPFEATVSQDKADKYGFKVLPSTSYDFNGFIKTLTSPDARYQIQQYDIKGALLSTITGGSPISGTNDWTSQKTTFVTNASAAYVVIRCVMNVAGSIGTNWYAGMKLDTTVPSARGVAVNRGVASNRFVAHDFGTSLRNDGTNASGVTIPAHADFDFSATGFTFNIFIKRIESLLATKRIVNKRSGNNGFLIQTRSEGRVEYAVGNGSSLTLGTFPLLRTRGWNAIGIACNLTTIRSYLNGVFVESKNLSGYTDAVATALTFLSDFSSGGFNGLVDMAKIFNRPFIDAEMAALAQKQVVDRVSLVGEWNADEASGTTVNDSSGRGHHGTISGSTVYSTDIFKKARSVA